MYDEGAGEPMPQDFGPVDSGVHSKLKYSLEGIIPLILIIVIIAFLGHQFGFWNIPGLTDRGPMNMLIIGSPSNEFRNVLNQSKDLVRFDVRKADRLTTNAKDVLAEYDIVVLDQHLESNKEVSRQLGEAIQDYVSSGGKFILVMDSGIRRTNDSAILGWEATFGDVVPVSCDKEGASDTPSCLTKIHVPGRLFRADYKHPIMKGIDEAPREGGVYLLETLPVNINGRQIAWIEAYPYENQSDQYPGIVEQKLVLGKSLYFGYDPGISKGIFDATLEYLR
ncbi:hypothetical protein KKG83_03745 [Candidatus Micrarchaeota archaeon]|nr:hypothetical protein [Candidatus Micrarchaeota archaeon]MBU2476558.1 hypothetical protein [Candidatus Micrarchaeota archaeon]